MTGRGTIKPQAGFDANADAQALYKAMKGLGTDEAAILKVLLARSNAQRQQIKAAYKTLHGKDLAHELKSELTGKFETLIVALLDTPPVYDARCLKEAMKGAGTTDVVLIDILASRTCREIQEINKVYKEAYGKTLEDAVTGDTSGAFSQMLVVLIQANRQQGVQEANIQADAKTLFEAGEKKFGTDEEQFITILGNRSAEHLRREKVYDRVPLWYCTRKSGVAEKYVDVVQDMYKDGVTAIEESISRETSGHLKEVLLAVVKCAKSVPAFLAECLQRAMKGLGTDDNTLIQIMVSRSEIDMLDIRAEFRRMFATSLYKMIKGDTAGDYEKALLLLCGGDDA